MKILISGATGLVGSEIVRYCHAQNIAVNYLTTSKNKIVSNKNYSGFYWNPKTGEIDLDCFNDISAIINLAGASISKRWTTGYKKIVQSSRIDALRTLKSGLDQIDALKIKSFVSASAIGIYPNSLINFYTEDEKEVDDSFLGEVVQAWENEIDTFKRFHFKVAKIRIGLVLAKDGGALPEIAKPVKYYVGAAFGNGQQWQSWIHISDLARQFLYLIENQLEGVYNGVGPNPVVNTKLIKAVATALKKPLLLPNIPQIVMKIILGEMSYILFASQRVSSKKIEEEGFIFEYPNINETLRNIFSNKINEIDTSLAEEKNIS